MRCKFLGSFFLLFSLSSKGADCSDGGTIWGVLGHDITLNIPDFEMTDDTDDVRWEKGSTLVALFKRNENPYLKSESFEILKNGSLKIKKLMRNNSDTYNVTVYRTDGRCQLNKALDLRILEMVSKPRISWECSNSTLTCKVSEGTDVELKLYQGTEYVTSLPQKILSYQWKDLPAPFKCKATNKVSSKESDMEDVNCQEKGLLLYVIVGASAGGLLLVLLGALSIFCICKRKKRNKRRKDEEVEIKASRMNTVERGPKPHSTPAAPSQNPVASQAPPPPGHHLQTHGHRPLPPSHRTREHQQKKRPPPSGTQVHQQKGPPLPRPRVQPKPPSGSGEVSLPPPN
ncbi:T-cell surface antigen CD2 isoform X2 [Arvicanthis niloticus]|uniref:T-cell surface antigen CD2 isoform X2 n=1 Tax=Arvicanthis niloticus TaxID=61156 RepID=UPI0014872841|nr:T-cell surface antigen CD2 [Arvicanthis niloticus]